MRVVRIVLGVLLLTVGLPALLAGAGLWTAMQHRDPGGAFTGKLQNVTMRGQAVVVSDLDAMLRQDAPFARADDTRLRLVAQTPAGPAFVGIARAEHVAAYLGRASYTRIDGVHLGTGQLPVRTSRATGPGGVPSLPSRQQFWLHSGTGAVDWTPERLRDGRYSVVVMDPNGRSGLPVSLTAELRPGWINSATWGLIILGTLLVAGGMMVLGWPIRRREVVYVVEPSQVPELASRIGIPLPASHAARRNRGARPRTLADVPARSSGSWPKVAPPSAMPALTWPPQQSPAIGGATPAGDPVVAQRSPIDGLVSRDEPAADGIPVDRGTGLRPAPSLEAPVGPPATAEPAADEAAEVVEAPAAAPVAGEPVTAPVAGESANAPVAGLGTGDGEKAVTDGTAGGENKSAAAPVRSRRKAEPETPGGDTDPAVPAARAALDKRRAAAAPVNAGDVPAERGPQGGDLVAAAGVAAEPAGPPAELVTAAAPGAAAARSRRRKTAAGLPAADMDAMEPIVKPTRPSRSRSQTRPPAKD